MIGQATWSFADEFALGLPGLAEEYDWLPEEFDEYLANIRDFTQGEAERVIDPETGEEIDVRMGPETTAGKVGAAVGTVGGFILGGPMKVLKGAGWAISKATRLATG
jgi:hypothetical protein